MRDAHDPADTPATTLWFDRPPPAVADTGEHVNGFRPAPYENGSAAAPYQNGASSASYENGSAAAPYQNGAPSTSYQTGSTSAPYQSGSTSAPYQNGSPSAPYEGYAPEPVPSNGHEAGPPGTYGAPVVDGWGDDPYEADDWSDGFDPRPRTSVAGQSDRYEGDPFGDPNAGDHSGWEAYDRAVEPSPDDWYVEGDEPVDPRRHGSDDRAPARSSGTFDDDPDYEDYFDDEEDEDLADVEATSNATRNALEWAVVLVGAILVALLLRASLFQAFWIPSESMETTLLTNDRVLVNKVSYRLHEIHRGDIVVFTRPESEPGGIRDLIKRVIALPGERVEGRDNQIFINGQLLLEPYLDDGVVTSDFGPVIVPEGQVFVMGDNRGDSRDSRFFGPVAEERVIGRAFVLFWPLDRFGSL